MTSVNPYDHLIRLYQILFAQVNSAVPTNSCKQIPLKVFKTDIVPGACAVCRQSGSLKSLQKNYSHCGEFENYSKMLLSCFNIEMVSLPRENQDLQICEVCIGRLLDSFNFRKLVETAQGHLLNEGNIQNGPKINEKPGSKDADLSVNVFPGISNYSTDDDNSDSFFNQGKRSFDNDLDVNVKKKVKKSDKIVIPKLAPYTTVCPVCEENFRLSRDLKRHFPVHFSCFLCEICGSGFLEERILIGHMETHKKKLFSCKLCSKRFSNSARLSQHVGRIHGSKKPFRCTVCAERFTEYSSMSKHIVQMHEDTANIYNCLECPKKFYRSSRLSEHMRRAHLKIKNYGCAICQVQFFSEGELGRHMLKHNMGVTEFKCNECGKSYARKRTLSEHLKIHANLRAHKCKLCDKAFVQKCTLKAHMKTHEKVSKIDPYSDKDKI